MNRVLFYLARPYPADVVAGGSLAIADSGTIASLVTAGFFQTPTSLLQHRLNLGHDCVASFAANGEPRGYGWIAYHSHVEDAIEMQLHLAEDEVFLYDFFVAPGHRGAGLYPAMLHGILALLGTSRSAQRVYIATRADNRASRRGIEKAGFDLAGAVSFCQIGRWTRRWPTSYGTAGKHPWTRNA